MVLNGRDPLLRDVLGLVPRLFARLGLDRVGVGLLDLEHRVAEREPLERARLLELRLRLLDARGLRQEVEAPLQTEPEVVVKVVPPVGGPHVVLRDGALGVETKSAPAPRPMSGKSFARLYSTSARRATMPARAMFTSGRRMRAASRYCAIETSGRSGRLSGSSGTSKLGLHARHEPERGHRVGLALRARERLRDHLLLELLEAQAIDVGHVRVGLRELLLHPWMPLSRRSSASLKTSCASRASCTP